MKQYIFHSILFALLCAFSQTSVSAQDMAMAKNNINKAYEALSRQDWPAFAALCADNYTEVNVGPTPTVGINNAIDLYKQFQAGFPDFMVKVNEIVPAGNNRYFLRVTVSGTNTGSMMMLPPTGKSIKFDGMDIVELNQNGKCVSHMVSNPEEPFRQIGYGSMTNPNTQTVIALYQMFGKGDVAGLLSMCDDKVVFEIQDRMFDNKARFFNGKAEVAKFFQELGSKFQYSQFQPLRFVADGDDVFILIGAEYTLAATGKKYSSTYTHHFTVSNGKVSYFRGVDDFQMSK